MKSHSTALVALLGIAATALLPSQAQAITTFVDADSNDFTNAIANSSDSVVTAGSTVTFDFDSSPNGGAPLTDGSLTNGSQTLTVTTPQQNRLTITGNRYGARPLGGSGKQVGFASPNNSSTSTITFNLAQPTTYFGIHIGDQFDISDTSTYTLSAGGQSIILPSAFSTGGSSTDPYAFNVPGTNDDGATNEDLTVGNNAYNFFGIVTDGSTAFQSATLTMTDPAGGNVDNFVFDSIITQADSGIVAVPFEFSPALGLVIVGIGFGGYKYRQNKLGNKDLS